MLSNIKISQLLINGKKNILFNKDILKILDTYILIISQIKAVNHFVSNLVINFLLKSRVL